MRTSTLLASLLLAGGTALAQAPATQPGPASQPTLPSSPSRPATGADPLSSTADESSMPVPSASPALGGPPARAPSALPVDPRGDAGWGSPIVPQVGTGLENILNSAAPPRPGHAPRKVCPPGMVSRDGFCAAPTEGILR